MDIKKTLENLEKNNMEAYFAESADEMFELLRKLIKPADTVAVGGSATLSELGVIDYIRKNHKFIDRYIPNLSREEVVKRFKDAFFADVFLSSSNAITENGELYNVDGNGNRVAAITFGPDSVIIIAGVNKIVKDVDEAVKRVKCTAAPKNCIRLSRDTYCAKSGSCVLENGKIGSGCDSDDRICSTFTVTAKQCIKNRIKVILLNENAGF